MKEHPHCHPDVKVHVLKKPLPHFYLTFQYRVKVNLKFTPISAHPGVSIHMTNRAYFALLELEKHNYKLTPCSRVLHAVRAWLLKLLAAPLYIIVSPNDCLIRGHRVAVALMWCTLQTKPIYHVHGGMVPTRVLRAVKT